MAFAGLHVAFGYMKRSPANTAPIYGPLISAETMAAAGTTSAKAPAEPSGLIGDPMASVRSSADAWISVGANPVDPTVITNPRRFVPANTTVDFFCSPFDRVRWALA